MPADSNSIGQFQPSQDWFSHQEIDAASREQQVRDYINQTLKEYGQLQPYAGMEADLGSQGRQTQLSALGAYGGLLDTGWDPQSREMQRQALNRSNEATAGQRGALLQQAQMSGGRTGPGSSAALANVASAGQGGANAQAQAGRTAQAAALGRRLQALGAYGSLAGAIRGGDINAQETGFQNRLQQIGGESAARNSLANYYTNQLNQGAAQNAANWQAALGAGGIALGGAGLAQNYANRGGPYDVGYSTDYGAGSLLPAPGTFTPLTPLYNSIPDYWKLP
jgi:hypothetical protein